MDSYGNYITADYGRKYYKTVEIENPDPTSTLTIAMRLEIHEKDYTGADKEIGELQSIHLNLEGDRGTIEAPIVKTTLTFTMVDTWDIEDDAQTKHGNWSEFYTPDSTKYLVRVISLAKNSQGQTVAQQAIWSGYITPDSWQESLAYRGSITITARDNIGHLQDFEFDLTPDGSGLVSVRDILTGAMAKINLPMDFYINATQDNWSKEIYYDGVNLVDTLINASHFEGNDWYAALEEVLDSLGLVLRFVDANRVCVGLICNMTHLDSTAKRLPADDIALTFLGGGTRTIDPPYRSIKDELRYDYEKDPGFYAEKGQDRFYQFGTVASSVVWNIRDSTSSTQSFNNPVGYNENNSDGIGWVNDPSGIPAYVPALYGKNLLPYDEEAWKEQEENTLDDAIFILAGSSNNMDSQYAMQVASTDLTLRLVFGRQCAMMDESQEHFVPAPRRILKVTYYLYYIKNNEQRYWDGEEWGTTRTNLESDSFEASDGTPTIEIPLVACQELGPDGMLYVGISKILTWQTISIPTSLDVPTINSLYARLKSIEVSSNNDHTVSDTVFTLNDEAYNVRFNRNPQIGALSYDIGRLVPGNYTNILYYRSGGIVYPWGYNVRFGGDVISRPLPAAIHMQILALHLEPMEILEGDVKTTGWGAASTYSYKGVRFMLVSGGVNLLTQRLEGCVFREFKEFSDVWPTNAAGPGTNQKQSVTR